MKQRIVYYHANCDDGFGSALAARYAMGDTADYIAMRYDERPNVNDCKNKDVYCLDLTFPYDVMLEIQNFSSTLIVLDHHKTVQEALEKLKGKLQDHIEFDMKKSGAMLSWEHFLHISGVDEEAPLFFQYLQDQDLWTHKLPQIHEFVRNLRSLPMEFDVWENLLKRFEDKEFRFAFLLAGEQQERLYRKQVADIVKMGTRPITINGTHKGLQCNSTWAFASDVGHELATKSGTFGLSWAITTEGTIGCSLRSNGDYDVSELAKCFRGGGHKNAAGFTLQLHMLPSLGIGIL